MSGDRINMKRWVQYQKGKNNNIECVKNNNEDDISRLFHQ